MLQVKNVKKKYVTGDFEQIALNGVSLNLRDNEFVAILGPSGSGKTTLLNIIGGLDRYDSGDLVINGISTRKYKDRDWDSYRNHTVGFVFQSYNLIPHQTVLSNVELALTIGGISKAKRKQMALDALEQVGLREQAHKRPNQMSGGQMQRVAIARALVNNPRILLADEPTGALDTKTSVQVMELLKEVAKDRLVVMVTHNPELAEEYANRIVRVKDGNIIDDTNPLSVEEELPAVHKNLGKSSMSLMTSFGLSLNNLMTKKGRTFLTSFAGSIGIIGIALILSLSTGFQRYIDQIQEETMTSYPLTINREAADVISTILSMHSEGSEDEPEENTLVEKQYIASMMGSIATNDLEYFKEYLETHEEEYMDNIKLIKYSYSVEPVIYTVDAVDNLAQINPSNLMSSYVSSSYTSMLSSFGASTSSTFSEITDLDRLKENYELLYGSWPESYNEMVAVVSDPNQISDLMLYSLGFRDTKELKTLIQNVMTGETVETSEETMTITYDDLLNREMKLIDPSDLYRYNSEYGTYENMSNDSAYMEEVYENAEPLKIVGIIYSEENKSSSSTGVLYLPELTYHVIDLASQSEIVQKQLADKDVDVFSGKDFDDESEESGLDFSDMITIDEDKIAEAFQVNMDTDNLSGLGDISINVDQNQMTSIVMESSAAVAANLEGVTQSMVTALTTIDEQVSTAMLQGYTDNFVTSLPANLSDLMAMMGGGGSIPSTGGGNAYPSMGGGSGYPSMGEGSSHPSMDDISSMFPGFSTQSLDGQAVTSSEVSEDGQTQAPDPVAGDGAEEQNPDPEGGNTESDNTESGNTESGNTESGNSEGGTDTGNQNSGSDASGGSGSMIPGPGDISGIIQNMEMADYVIIEAQGENMPETYKAQAMTPEVFEAMVSQMAGQVSISPENLSKIAQEAFDLYIASLDPIDVYVMKVVPVSELPDPSEAVQQAIRNNEALIFQEAYNLAKEYTTLMVAAGMGQAVSQVMTPVMSSVADSLSGLSGLSDLFSGEDLMTVDTDKFAEAFQFDMNEDELSRLMESMLTGDDASYSSNLTKLGYQNLNDPTSISFYFKDFESKGNFTDWLENFNDTTEEEHQLTYSDITGILMGSVETIINSVTYVLIAFVSISLIVSSIMIGIITYISVLERTKEIGILRAIGASKRNISSIFNAETFIIGLLSGVIGVGMTYLLNIPINIVIHNVTGNPDITAVLLPQAAVILAVISTLLTMLGGLIPSRSASRKDPVIALRTE